MPEYEVLMKAISIRIVGGWWNLREWTKRHGQKWRCGKCRSGHIGTMWQGCTMQEWTNRHGMARVDNAGEVIIIINSLLQEQAHIW